MKGSTYLDGQLLLAMPGMIDTRFERAVIFLCSHTAEGAMGLVINEELQNLDFASLLNELDIDCSEPKAGTLIHAGGPVETGRGFVLHSADFAQNSTLIINEKLALTATVDILKAIAKGEGPSNHLVALGYAGWGAGQLEFEIQANSWLNADPEEEIIFHTELEDKWARAMQMLGVDLSLLSAEAGHA